MEGVVYEGWLVKSPPEKRIVKAKWRQRWFVLRHSGDLPGQFMLEYFTDNYCKKLKGRIDLDECEQVDAGLTFESKKTSHQFMFDIRTPKRTYYLVADTEAEMNKWVECICSVCGLKIHVEEDFLVPQDGSHSSNNLSKGSSADERSSSNPYIPISECHTGKPVLNGNLTGNGFSDLPSEPPPPPPDKNDWNLEQSLSDEFYDHPKPLGRLELNSEPMYNVPASSKSDFGSIQGNDMFNSLVSLDRNVDLADLVPPVSSTIPRRKASLKSEVEYDTVPSFHGSIKEIKPSQRSVQSLASHFENIAVKPSPGAQAQDSKPDYVNDINVPPRPPKPSKLRERHRYENFELPHKLLNEDNATYDTPPSSKAYKQTSQQQTNSFSRNDVGEDLSTNSSVPLSSSAGKELILDDTYDFPKFRSEDNINATVPLVQATGTSQKPRRHAYTNAPPGLFNNKDLIFNYEYRPSLMTSDNYFGADSAKSACASSDAITPPSPSAMGAYANIPPSPTLLNFQNDVPPAVHRDLKPKRVLSKENRPAVSFLTLQPPPGCRSRTKDSERNFRKTRAAPSPTPTSSLDAMPPIPNRFRHQPDMSATSDDERSNSSGSRRNSSNDDQARYLFNPAKKDEIQYLDLDLDSEPSPSPKSPERMSASTVYKKVDFVKTKAFNEMRQNVEESYRKSQ
ncbi:GRB2-associated-binding protein 1-like [Uloborus diversus]|uniref:GRB2-associated-binding protein 1-like n=1 Tax=Uloborus diversus TaxID=327109 RepID=UPI00240A842A|nr:GRB2-associated-binding protein 1-like [Uloborus diversus]